MRCPTTKQYLDFRGPLNFPMLFPPAFPGGAQGAHAEAGTGRRVGGPGDGRFRFQASQGSPWLTLFTQVLISFPITLASGINPATRVRTQVVSHLAVWWSCELPKKSGHSWIFPRLADTQNALLFTLDILQFRDISSICHFRLLNCLFGLWFGFVASIPGVISWWRDFHYFQRIVSFCC